MAAPSLQTLQRLAADTGYEPGTLEKVLRLLDLLQEISNDAFLRDRLALKGGTALNVFYLDLDRLSVDIDLNYVGVLDRADMLLERPVVDATLNRILAAHGYQVRRQPDEHAGGKWIARHASALGGQGTLEIDINYMMRAPLFGLARRDSIALGAAQATGALVVDLHEIIAGKLVALLDRRAARDLFDARRIFAWPDLNWASIKAAMLAFGASGRRDWRTTTIDAIGADPAELRQKLTMCLPRHAFADAAAIDAWIAETTQMCRDRLAPLLTLTPDEQAFLDGVLERGEINAALLNVDDDMSWAIAHMPMLQWKCAHVRKTKKGGQPG
jgi:predicted nucleotidyltransferase component of viral defense system